MTTTQANKLDGERIEFGPDGYRIDSKYHVTNLTGNADRLGFNAVNAPGIPSYGDPHPAVPVARVRSLSARPLPGSPKKWEVSVSYEQLKAEDLPPDPSQPAQGTTGGSLTTVTTQRDVNGNQITVSHTFSETDADGNITTETVTQGGEVEYQLPVIVQSFSRTEGPSLVGDLAKFYVGRVNSTFFLGGEPKTWMCTRINADTDDAGASYQVTYEFQYNPETWDATVVFIDPDSGRPPPDLVEGEGIKTVEVYRQANFNELGLVF